jgi:hypothetical protein
MRRLLMVLPVALVAQPNPSAFAQYYPYPPAYYGRGYYPPAYYYRPPPPPPPAYMYQGGPYYTASPAYNPANCGTPDQPKPCYR